MESSKKFDNGFELLVILLDRRVLQVLKAIKHFPAGALELKVCDLPKAVLL